VKTLLLIRHAKAETSFTLNDFERSLNERGKKDAPVMAKKIKSRNITIDAFVSSPAKRAKKTATLFCETLHGNTDAIIYISALYHATAEIFFEVVTTLDNQFDTVAVFSHNPGITDFANTLTAVKIDNMPTCAVFAVQAEIIQWADFEKSKKEFRFFDYPSRP
jgi:phosphohistidine phosphatase